MTDEKLSWKFALATAGVTVAAVLAAGGVIYAEANRDMQKYDSVSVTCDGDKGPSTTTFFNAKVSPPELMPTYPARDITVKDSHGKTHRFSGNECTVAPGKPLR